MASPRVDGWLLILVFTASDVDHEPMWSGIRGQLPVTVEAAENCTRFPGGGKRWSAVALAGITAAVIVHGSRATAPQLPSNRQESASPASRIALVILAPIARQHSGSDNEQRSAPLPGCSRVRLGRASSSS